MSTRARTRRRPLRPERHDRATRRPKLGLEHLEDRTVPALLGNQVFPADNPWNQRITAAPVAANSAAIINNIVTLYGDGRLHPDFGQDYHTATDLYGIPYNVVHGNSTPKTTFVIDAYVDESDVVPAPLPANPVIEGDFQNGPKPGVDNRGDSHMLIYDVDNNVAYEFGRASRPSENADGRWHADQETVWDMKTNTFRTLGWTSADAAGLSILAGLVRPDEGLPTSQGGQGTINHAIRFTLQNRIILNQFLYPASHVANPGNTNAAVQPPMGARFRLKASVDISQFTPQARIIAQAMKDYGLIVTDNGSNFFFSGASYAVDAGNQQTLTWDDNDVQDSVHGLKSLTFSDFEVVDLTPVVTGLSAHNGPAGTSVTVTGQNFAGAAGHLQVLFGGTPATSVSVLDDGHVVAVAPAGSGTVDVRVQSGVTAGADPQNIRSPVFGYGVSATTAADRFSYGSVSTPPPTVVVAAGADAGGNPEVRLFDAATGAPLGTFFAYAPAFRGGVRVAVGDVTGDGTPDYVTAPGRGGGPNIRVWDGKTLALVRSFMAYAPGFTRGVFVAAGDTNGDGFADIVTGTDAGGAPHVEVFSGRDGALLQSFFAYAPTFTGGTRVAAGDVNGDGRADIIVGAGPGGGPHVVVFDGTNVARVLHSFMAFAPTFTGGVYVAAGDVNGDGRADIAVGSGAGGPPRVTVFSGTNRALLLNFLAYAPSFTGGVRVSVLPDVNGDGLADIATAAGPRGGPHMEVFSGRDATVLDAFFAFDPTFLGGVFIGGR
jgi:FG-GAP-like repeat/IPT/TIG domain